MASFYPQQQSFANGASPSLALKCQEKGSLPIQCPRPLSTNRCGSAQFRPKIMAELGARGLKNIEKANVDLQIADSETVYRMSLLSPPSLEFQFVE